jgi:diguanylate cyclase (GGDEF)-like protein
MPPRPIAREPADLPDPEPAAPLLRAERRSAARPHPRSTRARRELLRRLGRVAFALGTTGVAALFLFVGPTMALLGAVALFAAVEAAHTSELRHRAAALAQLTRLDELTGLGNARALWHDLPGIVAEGRVALIILDIDRFKQINDELGHPVGDAVLRHAAAELREVIAGSGGCYRYGGDELVALLPDGDEQSGAARAEALRARVAAGAVGLPPVTVSIGVAAGTAGAGAHQLLDRADRALRQAKTDGRDRVMLASQTSPESDDDLVARAARRAALAMAAAATDARDPESAGHSDDVLLLCEAMAERLGILGADRDHLLAAARLHDVGKAGIPQDILRKPGPLNAAEWAVMYEHTLVGERILERVPELAPVAPIVRHAHERWDGTGYPDRLAGKEIPLASRVLLCADAFHAMRSDRPYRGGRGVDEALAEIEAHAGTQFDPEVAQALVDVVLATRRGRRRRRGRRT